MVVVPIKPRLNSFYDLEVRTNDKCKTFVRSKYLDYVIILSTPIYYTN